MKECLECGETAEKLYEDPRTPPLEIAPCLCAPCARECLDHMIEELENQRDELPDDENIMAQPCPDCGGKVRAKTMGEGGGIVCTSDDCDYWFCY